MAIVGELFQMVFVFFSFHDYTNYLSYWFYLATVEPIKKTEMELQGKFLPL